MGSAFRGVRSDTCTPNESSADRKIRLLLRCIPNEGSAVRLHKILQFLKHGDWTLKEIGLSRE